MANALSELWGGITGAPSGVASIVNVGRTQLANATGQQIPGLNTTIEQKTAGTVANNQSTYWLNGREYNASGSPTGKIAASTGTGDTTTNSSYAGDGGAGAASDAQQRAATLFGIDTGINQANDALGRLDSQAQTGYGNISREYQDAYNRLMAGKTSAQDQYQRGVVDQTNNYLAKRTQNDQQAANWLMGAQRTLGVQGAGGGSAARYALPYEAQTQAAQQNSSAQSTNNQNIGALTSNWNKANTDFTNSEGDLQRQRDQGTNDYASKIAQQRADLLNNLGQLQGQRAIANGGDFRAAQAAANPYTSRISSILSQIDGLSATPNIREQQVTVGRPDLSQYNFTRPEAAPAPLQDVSIGGGVAPIYADQQDQTNPLLALFGLGQDQRQLV